jgi:tetratricopeptide (TPR) repeat protein
VDTLRHSDEKQSASEPLAGPLTEIALGYQRTLERNPRQPQALLGMSLVALASGQTESAITMARAGTAAAPRMPEAWIALGQALKAAGCLDQAECAYAQAINLDGTNALARMGLGELELAHERPESAVRQFELALRAAPRMAGAHLSLGHALASMSRREEALAHYEHALTLRPRLPEAEFAAGFVLAQMGSLKQAEIRYRRAIAARPDFAAAWINLGSLLREQGRDLDAEAALRRAVELRPDLVSGWISLAALERERGRFHESEKYLRRALTLNPDQVETLIAWSQFHLAQRDWIGAGRWIHKALGLAPDHAEAVNLDGILLHLDGRLEEAVARFERAEALGDRAAVSNRGNALLDMGRMDEALKAHEHAVERDPNHPGAAYDLALTELRLGHWERGWPGYEARWRFREVHRSPRLFKQPRWKGEPLHGQRILLHAEQGLGDTIQFCRYAELVAAHGGVPVLAVQEPVERLLFSLSIAREGNAEVMCLGAPPPACDWECPLMSLPAVFRTTVNTVPWPGAYLHAEPGAAEAKRAQFPSRHPGMRIGLAWAGNPRYKADHQRSLHLDLLLPLLRAGSVSRTVNWISLQKGAPAEQLAAVPAGLCLLDGSSRDRDLAETAALVATLDLVITTDTSIAHLAGAMAKPVWILLPHLADWRWMQETETIPWYPTARLFRQTNPAAWEGVLDRVAVELRQFKPVGVA